ncbi:uncharacterized protein LOC130246144 isoform X2 [Danio aesculapii]|uniref:uncharacterized protein LOC130246144 isoform X2 n=1 Tax=Danio aesculapii TaxID=1142201 RepID=UPI0024BF50EA|nr:uncharacterized protein LOC130246144 isoform X2 [Danio aesculapii]
MSLACLSLSAGEASMEALELELEAVESQIRSLETKREGIRALLLTRTRSSEVSVRYNDNLPVSSTPRVSLSRPSAPRTRFAQASFTPTPGYHGPWVQPRKVLARSRGRTSPPPVFEIPTENRFGPLRETGRDVAIIGDSIVRHVRSTSSKDTYYPERCREPRCRRPPRGDERHRAPADGDPEEGLQEPDRDGSTHFARHADHRFWTASYLPPRK